MDWQPIETFFGRSDRTGIFLLFIPGYGVTTGRCEFTGFNVWKADGGVFRGGNPVDSGVFEYSRGSAPTHWMPLPSPPTDGD